MPALSRLALVPVPLGNDGTEFAASHLGKALTIKGRLETIGVVHIYGTVNGQITADRLVIGAGSFVEGDIIANDVRIGGRFTGRIYARHVTLDGTADITGRIFHHTVTVAKGARIDGRMPWRPLNFFERLEHLREAQ
jgi:cytoskeletal protein CcmA (bactofilin family)